MVGRQGFVYYWELFHYWGVHYSESILYVLLFFCSSLPMVMASAVGLVFRRRSHRVRSRSCWSCPASFMSGAPILLVWVFRGSVDATLSIGCLAVGSTATTRLLMPAVLTTIQLFRTPLPLGMHAVTGSGGMVWLSPAVLMFFLSNQAKLLGLCLSLKTSIVWSKNTPEMLTFSFTL